MSSSSTAETVRRSHRPSNWLHDKESFFKYTTRDVALAIVTSGSLRWSSPQSFNDPFDMQFNMRADFDAARLRPRVLEFLWAAHYSPDGTVADNELGQFIKEHKSEFPKLSREEFDRVFGEGFDEDSQRWSSFCAGLNSTLQQGIRDVKVLCLSDRRDSILMWSHYAELHEGVVLEFACVPERDSVWGAAMPVKYGNMPPIFEEEFVTRFFSGQASIGPIEMLNRLVTAKATDWAYEREWRIVLYSTDPTQATQDIPFHADELAGVYLGCRMSSESRKKIVDRVREKYPSTKIFAAEKMDHQFGIQFREDVG